MPVATTLLTHRRQRFYDTVVGLVLVYYLPIAFIMVALAAPDDVAMRDIGLLFGLWGPLIVSSVVVAAGSEGGGRRVSRATVTVTVLLAAILFSLVAALSSL